MTSFDALVIAGGAGARLGGVDKGMLVVGGERLLDRARHAVAAAQHVAVVGPDVTGGPVAAIAAGLSRVRHNVTVVLACDMPFVTSATVHRLVSALHEPGVGAEPEPGEGWEAALLTDASGRRQFLAGAYDTAALRDALTTLGPAEGRSMRDLVARLRVREVPAHAEEATDCDTWADIHKAAKLLEKR